jgi:hypothetical protein
MPTDKEITDQIAALDRDFAQAQRASEVTLGQDAHIDSVTRLNELAHARDQLRTVRRQHREAEIATAETARASTASTPAEVEARLAALRTEQVAIPTPGEAVQYAMRTAPTVAALESRLAEVTAPTATSADLAAVAQRAANAAKLAELERSNPMLAAQYAERLERWGG